MRRSVKRPKRITDVNERIAIVMEEKGIRSSSPGIPEDRMIMLKELQDQTGEQEKEILQQLILFNAIFPQKRLAEWMIKASREIKDPVLKERFMKIAVNWYIKG